MTASRRFFVSAFAVIAVCGALVRTRAYAANPDVAAWGITFDLTITIPLLYWFFFVRAGHAKPLTLAPLFIVCTLLASRIVPRDQQTFLRQLAFLAVPLELLIAGAIVQRVRSVGRRKDRIDIGLYTRSILGEGRIADVVASELAMLYYAFFCWKREPDAVEGRPITFHERSGWGSVVACILVLIAAEGIGMHFLLARWNTFAAWGWTILDVWGAVWLIGDHHALRTRRSSLDGDALHIRLGLRWSVTVALSNIASIEAVHDEREWKRRGTMKIALLEAPRWLVTLREPVVARGLAGLRKEVHALALLPDDEEIVSVLRHATSTAMPIRAES